MKNHKGERTREFFFYPWQKVNKYVQANQTWSVLIEVTEVFAGARDTALKWLNEFLDLHVSCGYFTWGMTHFRALGLGTAYK